MNRIDPPLDPNQLPPKTDDFTFCNVSLHPAGPIDFVAEDPNHSETVHLPGVPPAMNSVVDTIQAIYATRVVCDAALPGYQFHYEYSDTPAGWFVAKMICGAQQGAQGGIVPFGLVILRELNNGPGVQTVALQYDEAYAKAAG